MVNNIKLIESNFLSLKEQIKFWDFKSRHEIKRALSLLHTINQEALIIDSNAEEIYHKESIEIFSHRTMYFENDIEYVWNINQITDVIIKEQGTASIIATEKLISCISDKDIKKIIFESNYQKINDEVAPYKINNPIIFMGRIDDHNAVGILLNGNHRVIRNSLKKIEHTEVYIINPNYGHYFLISEEYMKLYEVILIYNMIKYKITGKYVYEWQKDNREKITEKY